MQAELTSDPKLEIGHVLFVDIVAYSKLLSSEQRELFALLNDIVRNTSQFRAAEAAGKLVRLSTGDGMVMVFFTSVDMPVRCAQEISRKLREHPELKLRMGINSGPVDQVSDVNDQRNITGVGINQAQRVMDCGDAGHILLSRRVADDLAQYSEWKSHLHELGQFEVKHGAKIDVVNFYNDEVGNAEVPEKFKLAREQIVRADRLVATRRRKRIILSAALFVAIASGIGLWTFFRWSSLRIAALPISDKSIAVLPFENLSDEKENAYFTDGVQNEIQAKLSASEKASIEEKPTQDLVAYDFYVRAVSIITIAQAPSQADLVNFSDAVDLLNKAVGRDPNFLLAYCELGFVHDLIYNGDTWLHQRETDHTPARLALAKAAIDSAFRLRADSGEAHLALGWHLYWGYADYTRARAELALAQKSLPNNPQAFELAGLIDRRQGRWADAIHNLERACELDPRNNPYLVTLGTTYLWLHDYDQMVRVMDRIISLDPGRRIPRMIRAQIEVDQRAHTGPVRAALEHILTNEPGSEKDPFVAGWRLDLALLDRDLDAAGSLAGAIPQKEGRDFSLGVVARSKGDVAAARAAFMRARTQLEEELRVHPDNMGLLADLGLIDAALGRKEEALRE